MSNGFFNIVGTQTAGPNYGAQELGPFTINFAAPVHIVTVTVADTQTVGVTPDSGGVFILPPEGNTTPSISVRTVLGDTGIRINPGGPTYLDWDPAAIPTNLYFTSGGSVNITLQFV